LIGICTALERARWSVWDQRAALLPLNYIEAVQRAGGIALLLPPDPQLAEEPDQVLELIDGLILAGGADIDPSSTVSRPTLRRTTRCRRATPSKSRWCALRSSATCPCSVSAGACS